MNVKMCLVHVCLIIIMPKKRTTTNSCREVETNSGTISVVFSRALKSVIFSTQAKVKLRK